MRKEIEEKCPTCGEEMTVRCHVGAYVLCRKCSSAGSMETALKIAKSKHREKLELIWKELQKEKE